MRPLDYIENAQLRVLGLREHYIAKRGIYVSIAANAIHQARSTLEMSRLYGPQPNANPQQKLAITRENAHQVTKTALKKSRAWNLFLLSKPNVPYERHDNLTDMMARYIVEDAYDEIV